MVFYDSSDDYFEARKRVMTCYILRQETINELEVKHVTHEFYDLDIQTFLDYCDRMVALYDEDDDKDNEYKDEDENEDENEDKNEDDDKDNERQYVEAVLNEAMVPKIVWDALWV